MDLSSLGKWMVLAGLALAIAGIGLLAVGRLGIPLGGLPGDVHIQREKFSFHFPVVTCIVLSIVLTILLNLVVRFFGK